MCTKFGTHYLFVTLFHTTFAQETKKTKLMAVNSRANKEKIAITDITVEVENLDELNKVLKVLRKVDSVYEVIRKK